MKLIVLICLISFIISTECRSFLEKPHNFVGSTTYYVSNAGNDGNIGSSTLPFKTIAKAFSVVADGDTVLIVNYPTKTYGGEKKKISKKKRKNLQIKFRFMIDKLN